jgi:hypothetical protein
MARADAACRPVVNLQLHAESITSTCGRRHAPQSTRILCRSCLMISAASALRHTYHAVHVTLFFASFPVVFLSIVCRLDPSSILTPTIICCGMLLFCFMQAQPCQSDPIKLIALQQRGSSLFDARFYAATLPLLHLLAMRCAATRAMYTVRACCMLQRCHCCRC